MQKRVGNNRENEPATHLLIGVLKVEEGILKGECPMPRRIGPTQRCQKLLKKRIKDKTNEAALESDRQTTASFGGLVGCYRTPQVPSTSYTAEAGNGTRETSACTIPSTFIACATALSQMTRIYPLQINAPPLGAVLICRFFASSYWRASKGRKRDDGRRRTRIGMPPFNAA